MLFNLANLPYWMFLSLGIVLFLLVIAGGGGDEYLGIDADANADFMGVCQATLLLFLAINLSLWGAVGWMFNILVRSISEGIPVNFFWLRRRCIYRINYLPAVYR
ncbi:hypothetical protein [Microcoleus sp. FACHB-68]|uniref:hypothetical protein n=1 Tax=Microcoleus sp. FACHB-68 TaxID=2692826 RepID=UPI001685586C|nr:hypothetical protein [Microcoleus sp. FACHB-68]MBD1936137.1 hypothetical protein [Microcoleus sp. FACHB-68]